MEQYGKRIEDFNKALDNKLTQQLANAISDGNSRIVQNILSSGMLPQQQAQEAMQSITQSLLGAVSGSMPQDTGMQQAVLQQQLMQQQPMQQQPMQQEANIMPNYNQQQIDNAGGGIVNSLMSGE